MKQNATLRSLLGLSQEEMAQLLQTSRSQISMYECCQRDLPRTAKVFLAPVLDYLASEKAKQLPNPGVHDPKAENYLAERLQHNELQCLGIIRKLGKIRAAREKNSTVLQLIPFLSEQSKNLPGPVTQLVNSIQAKASNALTEYNATLLLQYEIKLEVLAFERKVLEQSRAKNLARR